MGEGLSFVLLLSAICKIRELCECGMCWTFQLKPVKGGFSWSKLG